MANVTFYQSQDMFNPYIWYGNLISYDGGQITISDGFHTGTYYGSFQYDYWGLIGRVVNGYNFYVGNTLSATVRDANADALTVAAYLNQGDAEVLESYVFRMNDKINGSAFPDSLRGYAGSDAIYGNDGNDLIDGGAGDDFLDGGAGIDTAFYSGSHAAHTLTRSGSSYTVQDNRGIDGTDTLNSIERLHFSDTKLALDLDGNAGTTAKILGVVFGASSVTNKEYVGIGISFLDSGTSYEDLMHFALTVAGATTHAAVVNLIWTNLFNFAPTIEEASPYISMLGDGSMSVGALGILAADLPINTSNINLVGLHQTGIEYFM